MADLPVLERSGESLNSYLDRRGYSGAFRDDHLAPMAAAIWSQPQGTVADMPAATLIRFFAAHGLLRLSNRPRWRTVTGGSQAYVAGIGQYLVRRQARLHMGTPVVSVRRGSTSVTVTTASGRQWDFDHVVLAVHGDQALAMLADADAREQEVLGAFTYRPNRVVLHRDRGLMPVRRAAWAAWNYIAPDGPLGPQGVTYWMNRLQNFASEEPIFVTLNPPLAPAVSRVINEFTYSHPVFDSDAVRAQRHLAQLQGRGCTWFCGSYFGYGFHEDAFASGINAAALMGVPAPWAMAAALRPAAE
jgi:predicted NAD/FAD-binding protein